MKAWQMWLLAAGLLVIGAGCGRSPAEKLKTEEGQLAAINERMRMTNEANKNLFEPPPCEQSGQPSARAGPADLERSAQLTRQAEALNAKRSRAAAFKAIPLAREAVETRRQVLGDQHPDVAESLVVLGDSYLVWGGPHVANTPAGPAAKSVLNCALVIQEKTLGSDHLDVAQTLYHLGRLHAMSPDRGKPLFERALAIRMKHLGPHHPLTLETQFALNRVDPGPGQADPDRIEPLLRKVLANREKTLGLDHPDLEEALTELLLLSFRKGNAEEADRLGGRLAALHEARYASSADDDPTLEAKVILSRIRRVAVGKTGADPERLTETLIGLRQPPRYSYWQVVNGAFVRIQGGAQDTTPCDVTQPPTPMNLMGIGNAKGEINRAVAVAKGNLDADALCDEWTIHEDGMLSHVIDDI